MVIPFARRPHRPPEDARLIALLPGQPEAVVEGAVLRGERALFTVVARAGQRLSVVLDAAEDNAVLRVHPPGRPPGHPGVARRIWTGTVAASGPWLIEVGPLRGNATYRLRLGLG